MPPESIKVCYNLGRFEGTPIALICSNYYRFIPVNLDRISGAIGSFVRGRLAGILKKQRCSALR